MKSQFCLNLILCAIVIVEIENANAGLQLIDSGDGAVLEEVGRVETDIEANLKTSVEDCFGRLHFKSVGNLEWPIFYDKRTLSLFNRSFSNGVFDRGDSMTIGDVSVAVLGPNSPDLRSSMEGRLPSVMRKSHVDSLQNNLAYLKRLKYEPLDEARKKHSRRMFQDEVVINKKNIEKIDTDYQELIEISLNAKGYWTREVGSSGALESLIWMYVSSGEHIYVFESRRELAQKERHKSEFLKFLRRFRTRAANEIPSEPGVCIPHGFIRDDGKSIIEFKQSLRWKDAPGVLYTIQTGNLQRNDLKDVVFLAAMRAGVGQYGSASDAVIASHLAERVGPSVVKIGDVEAAQGGVALVVKKPGSETFEAYSVFTGASGELDDASAPYILVDMRTVRITVAPELKTQPPPFKQSMNRLEMLLKDMRVRRTAPSS